MSIFHLIGLGFAVVVGGLAAWYFGVGVGFLLLPVGFLVGLHGSFLLVITILYYYLRLKSRK